MFAVQKLVDRGVKEIVICELRWIAPPLGCYLVDALGTLNMGDNSYTTFRVSIRDSTSESGGSYSACEEFVSIALGKDHAEDMALYPHPGPDYDIAQGEGTPDELLAYEFLLDREMFVTLSDRYC